MDKKLLIIGAGGHGRCCLDIAREQECYSEIRFLDDASIGSVVNGALIVNDMAHLEECVGEYTEVFVAIGNNSVRKQLMEKVEAYGGKVVSLISRRSCISEFATVENGSAIFPGAVIEANATLGKGSVVAANSIINHDAVIKDYCLVNSGTIVRPNTRIGTLTRIGCGCIISFGKELCAESDVQDGKIV